jgi:DNA-binding transcriptional MerR regulator
MSQPISIGALSAQTGVKVPTIRYYENIGLLPAPPRTGGNRRVYDARSVDRLYFIRHARELGFEIETIKEMLGHADQPQRSCAKVDALARAHLEVIDSRIDRLKTLKREVEGMIRSCARGKVAECRIIESLTHGG